MGVERFDVQGVKTAGQLFEGLTSSGIPAQIASELYSHEKAHADADTEGRGEFGFVKTAGWIVAYYLVSGERVPEVLMEIAKAPGFSNMSSQDWLIYNRAWRQFLRQQQEENFKHAKEVEGLREKLIEKLTERLDGLAEEQRFPSLQELLGYEFKDLMLEFGQLLYQTYKEAIIDLSFEIEKA